MEQLTWLSLDYRYGVIPEEALWPYVIEELGNLDFSKYTESYPYFRYMCLKNPEAPAASSAESPQLCFFPEAEPSGPASDIRPAGRAGRKGYPFLPMFTAFVVAPLLGVPDGSSHLRRSLVGNPAFWRGCGFKSVEQVPSRQTLDRFNAIMIRCGIWRDARVQQIKDNIKQGVFKPSPVVAVDTVHSESRSLPNHKTCGCADQEHCSCPVTDDVCGVVRKSATVTHLGLKYSLLVDTASELPYTGDPLHGSRNDGKGLPPLLERFEREFPELFPAKIRYITADGPYYSQENRDLLRNKTGDQVKLVSRGNPGSRKDRSFDDVPGVAKIDKRGYPICLAGLAMLYLGRDRNRQQYIFGCPVHHPKARGEGKPPECSCRERCCGEAKRNGRIFRVDRDEVPWINWELPEYSVEFSRVYNRRTSVERLNSRLVDNLGFREQRRRGRKHAQAHIDRYLLLLHLIAAAACRMGQEERIRCVRSFAA